MRSEVVRSPIAPLLGEPRISASLISQLLYGEVVTVLDQPASGPGSEPASAGAGAGTSSDWLRVSGADGYEGWIHRGYLRQARGDEAEWGWSLGCVIREHTGDILSLPVGARVARDSIIESGVVISERERVERFAHSGEALALTARSLFSGASYLWGGTSPWGVDCSGLVQRAGRLHGFSFPRDAWQQAEATRMVVPGFRSNNNAGDLLFFSDRADRRVTHVGISLGGSLMVHSALRRGRVTVEQLSADSPAGSRADSTADGTADGTDHDPYVMQLRAQCVGVHQLTI